MMDKRSRLLLVSALLLTGLSSSVVPVGAAGGRPGIRGSWQFTIRIQGARSQWDALIRRHHRQLRGHAKPVDVDCKAIISGTVKHGAISMVWTVTSSCTNEVISFDGQYRHHHLRGSVSDSRLGTGRFTAWLDGSRAPR